jgi:hypothetical protein
MPRRRSTAPELRGRWCSATMRTWSIGSILLVIAIIAFVLDAIGLKTDVSLIAVGLAFFAASFLVGALPGGSGPRL